MELANKTKYKIQRTNSKKIIKKIKSKQNKKKKSVILAFLKLMKDNQFSNIFAEKLTKKKERLNYKLHLLILSKNQFSSVISISFN